MKSFNIDSKTRNNTKARPQAELRSFVGMCSYRNRKQLRALGFASESFADKDYKNTISYTHSVLIESTGFASIKRF